MTPAKRRPATPASQRPTRARVPDVPSAPPDAPVPDEVVTVPAATKDGTLLGPEGEPIAQRAPRGDAGGDSAPATQTGQVDAEERPTTQSPRRSGAFYPLPVWPD